MTNELLARIDLLEQENQRLKEENKKLKNPPKQIKEYILTEMYVDMGGMTVIAGWLQFDELLKIIEE